MVAPSAGQSAEQVADQAAVPVDIAVSIPVSVAGTRGVEAGRRGEALHLGPGQRAGHRLVEGRRGDRGAEDLAAVVRRADPDVLQLRLRVPVHAAGPGRRPELRGVAVEPGTDSRSR